MFSFLWQYIFYVKYWKIFSPMKTMSSANVSLLYCVNNFWARNTTSCCLLSAPCLLQQMGYGFESGELLYWGDVKDVWAVNALVCMRKVCSLNVLLVRSMFMLRFLIWSWRGQDISIENLNYSVRQSWNEKTFPNFQINIFFIILFTKAHNK